MTQQLTRAWTRLRTAEGDTVGSPSLEVFKERLGVPVSSQLGLYLRGRSFLTELFYLKACKDLTHQRTSYLNFDTFHISHHPRLPSLVDSPGGPRGPPRRQRARHPRARRPSVARAAMAVLLETTVGDLVIDLYTEERPRGTSRARRHRLLLPAGTGPAPGRPGAGSPPARAAGGLGRD